VDALTAEIRGHLQAGYRYALALTHHHYEAEDLVQEAWLRFWCRSGSAPLPH
jgi:DNA-directed RNA polymerase specialized sigma24 family protein